MKIKICFLLIFLCLFTGCATNISESGLYWGDYSKTLYAYKKTPSKETLALHKNELIRIIAKSMELKLRTPPGVQSELGMIYANEDDLNFAKKYYSAEAEIYPESGVLMNRLIEITDKKEKK